MPRKKTGNSEPTLKIEKKESKLIKRNYIYAVGRRKTSIARIRLFKNGKGSIIVNEKDYKKYFPQFEYRDIVEKPLVCVGKRNNFNFTIKTHGGGVRGQAEAIRHGISRTLIQINKDWRKTLKPLGFLKRDPRKKERKKPGLKRARRAPQWKKR